MRSTAAGHDIRTSTTPTERQFVLVTAPIAQHLTSARANAAPGTAPQRKKLKPVIKSPLDKHLSKSNSTPQLREPIMSDSEAQKRNKLGYQRISIACAHCRRRKIRCLLTDDENEQRCQNCIRLKKECVFYPVDQQAAMDAKSEASGRTGAPSASSTVSSSPSQMSGRPLDHAGLQFGTGFSNIPSDGSRNYQGIPIVPSLTIPSQGNFAHPDHAFQARSGEMAVAWSPQEYGTQSPAMPMGDPAHMPQQFVRYGQQNMTVDTAPYPGSMDQSPQNLEQLGYASGPMLQQQWQPQQQPQQPVRSMSFPNNYADQMYGPSLHQSTPTSPYVQSPSFTQHSPDAQFMAPGSGTFVGPSSHYMSDQRSSSIPNPSPFHAPQSGQMWYPGATPYTSIGPETRTLPSQNDDGGQRTRPG